jgi:C-terminal processing protease CtpA/Prc
VYVAVASRCQRSTERQLNAADVQTGPQLPQQYLPPAPMPLYPSPPTFTGVATTAPPLQTSKVGIGVYFAPDADGGQVVSSFVPGGPAEQSGLIELGDCIHVVNGVNVYRKAPAELSRFLLGEPGTIVKIGFRKPRSDRLYFVQIRRGGRGVHDAAPDSGHRVGVGLILRPDDDGYLRVAQILPSSPAAASGLIAVGDVVRQVDGAPVDRQPLAVVQRLVLGEPGSSVQLAIQRPPSDQLIAVDLKRAAATAAAPAATPHASMRGSLGPKAGIGIAFKSAFEGALYVTQVVRGGPADAAGVIEVGDCLYEVDGRDVYKKALQEVMDLILGPPGTAVRLAFRKGGAQSLTHVIVYRGADGRPFVGWWGGGVWGRLSAAQLSTHSPIPPLQSPPPQQQPHFQSAQSQHQSLYSSHSYQPPPPSQQFVPTPPERTSPVRYAPPPRQSFGTADSQRVAYDNNPPPARQAFGTTDSQRADNPPPPRHQTADGRLYGVGIYFQPDPEGGLRVSSFVPSGPAERSGSIHVGDVIYQVDDSNVYGKTLSELAQFLLGPRGTIVRLGFRHGSSSRLTFVALERGASEADRRGTGDSNRTTNRSPPTMSGHLTLTGGAGGSGHHASGHFEMAAREGATGLAGVGLVFTQAADGAAYVMQVITGGPAWRTRLVDVGDCLHEVDGIEVFRKSLSFINSLLVGPVGSSVRLGLVKVGTERLSYVEVERGAMTM